ncbi:MAG TPA: hypothetical protein VHC72_02310, partial [Bryobacteraceae bacterium]|nr:hypothetical protein [Bryobacteraceae bacterium]
MRFACKVANCVALAVFLAPAHAQLPPAPFTASQVEQGKATWARNCAGCHGQNLDDGEFAPPVR